MSYGTAIRCTLVLALGLGLAACAGRRGGGGISPEQLFEEAREAADRGGLFGTSDCIKAERKVEELRQQYPYHARTVEAELVLAECAYNEGRAMAAIGRWEAFLRLHPGHAKSPEVLLNVAEAYMGETDDYDRDLGSAVRALNSAEELLRRYPESAAASEAVAVRKSARRLLAERELYVARFYRRQRQWQSAYQRYRTILDSYGDLKLAAEAREEIQGVRDRLDLPVHPDRPVQGPAAVDGS